MTKRSTLSLDYCRCNLRLGKTSASNLATMPPKVPKIVELRVDHRQISGMVQKSSTTHPKDVTLFSKIHYAYAARFQPAEFLPPETELTRQFTPWRGEPGALLPGVESVLTLDVVVPFGPPQQRMPVVVFFHGGCFNFGGPEERDLSSFVAWAPEHVVVVAVRYRLGVQGFFAGKWVEEEGEGQRERRELNLGLRDQRMAVEWVRRWIGVFGGDKDNLCLQGQSAGAHAVSFSV